MVVVDTNVYIDAMEDEHRAMRLAELIESSAEPVAVSSVVVAELLVGAHDVRHRTDLISAILGTVPPDRVLTPVHDDWERAGDALRTLGGDAVTTRRSFWNDLLIAATCARAGATLLTSNTNDFARISRVIPVEVVDG